MICFDCGRSRRAIGPLCTLSPSFFGRSLAIVFMVCFSPLPLTASIKHQCSPSWTKKGPAERQCRMLQHMQPHTTGLLGSYQSVGNRLPRGRKYGSEGRAVLPRGRDETRSSKPLVKREVMAVSGPSYCPSFAGTNPGRPQPSPGNFCAHVWKLRRVLVRQWRSAPSISMCGGKDGRAFGKSLAFIFFSLCFAFR